MKRLHIFCLVMLSILVSCQKESNTVTLGVTIENINGNPKLYIDNTLTPQWETGDSVWVNGSSNYAISFNGTAAQIANVTRTADRHYLAVYPAEIAANEETGNGGAVTINLPREQVFLFDNDNNRQQVKVPMIAYTTDGNSLQFKNLCSLLKITVHNGTSNNITLSRITLTASINKLSGSVTASIIEDEQHNKHGHLDTWSNESEHDVSLIFNNTETIGSTTNKEYYIVVPEYIGTDEISIIAYTTNGKFFPLLKNNVPLGHNTIATVTANIDQLQTTRENFTVNSSNGTVRFSKGNLQYSRQGFHATADNNNANGTWRFAKHQYDTIGAANNNISDPNYTGWLDLFGWGTSGYNYAPTLYSTSSTSYLNKKIDIAQSDYDWGVYNQIEDYQINTWRTLTYNEWDYILDARAGTTINSVSGVKYAEVSVNNTKGLLIFPDNFDWPSAVSNQIITYNNYHNTWNNVNYSIAQWSILDASGAIFLPAAGKRNGTNITETNQAGYYWTSSNAPSFGDTKNEARCLYFINNAVYRGNYYIYRYLGFSVRLVQDTQ